MNAQDEPPIQTVSSPPPVGLAIACLVSGILAACLSFLIIGGLLGIIGIVLGIVHLRDRAAPRTMAAWGIGLSLIGLLATGGFGFAYYQGYRQFQKAMAELQEKGMKPDQWRGVVAPNIEFTTLDGKVFRLADMRGKRVVLDFWATWCPPCVREIPHFIRLSNETSRDELVIVGISSEDAAKLKPFVAKQGITYPIASFSAPVAPYSGIVSIPTTFFIDRHGVIQDILVGYHDFDTLRDRALAKDHDGPPKDPPPTAGIPAPDPPREIAPSTP